MGVDEWIDAGVGLGSSPSLTFANSFIFLCLSFHAYCFACLVSFLSRSYEAMTVSLFLFVPNIFPGILFPLVTS